MTVETKPFTLPTLEPLRAPVPSAAAQVVEEEDDDDDDEVVAADGPALSVPLPQPQAPRPVMPVSRLMAPATPSAESVARADAAKIAKQAVEEFYEIIGGLDITTTPYKIRIDRMLPIKGMYDDGVEVPLKGNCESIEYAGPESIPTDESIREKFGGGTYQVAVWGPGANGKGFLPRAKKTIELPGFPKLPVRPATKSGSGNELTKDFLDRQDRERQRQADELRKERERADRLQNEMITRQTTMFAQLNAPKSEALIIAEAQERRETEARRAEEARRQHELQLKQMELQNQARIEEMRAQNAAAQAAAQAQAQQLAAQQAQMQQQFQQQQQQTQMMIQQMQQTATQQMQSSQQHMQMMMQQAQQQAQAQVQMLTTIMSKTDSEKNFFLEKALSRKEEDGIEKLLKMKQVIDVFSGNDGGEATPTWERVLDKVTDALPKVPAMLSAARGLQKPAAAPATKKQIQPGSVAVAELPEKTVSSQAQAPAQTEATAPAKEPETITVDPTANDLTELRAPTEEEQADIATSLTLLIKSVDLAIQQDMSAEDIVEKVVRLWPVEQQNMLTLQDVDATVTIIEERTPDSWKIVSPAGKRVLRKIHAIMSEKEGN